MSDISPTQKNNPENNEEKVIKINII